MHLPKLFSKLTEDKPTLIWLPEIGIGYYDVDTWLKDRKIEQVYDQAYFDKYVGYKDSEVGHEINFQRLQFVASHAGDMGTLLDVGIGSGAFVEAWYGPAKGTDINPVAIKWLAERDMLHDGGVYDIVTFWDSIEHIEDFESLLALSKDWVFISTPIYEDSEHILRSKHFRKDEHLFYWSLSGMIETMNAYGFRFMKYSTFEQSCGRENIGSFAFRRY